MSGITIPVAPGKQPTQLTGAPLAKGTTIYNADSTNAVWVSSASNVSPGNGQLIGPLGNAQWNNDSAQAFACVDTGVTGPVSVIVSGDISGVNNPVALAAATASILLAQGIPVVFQGSLISNVRLGPSGALTYTVPVDLSGYAGLCVNLFQIGPEQAITLSWLDAPGGNVLTGQTYMATASRMTGAGTGSSLKLMVAVKSPTLRIDFPLGSMPLFTGTGVLIYASNRLPVEIVGNVDLGVDYVVTQAFAANTPVLMGNFTTNGGLHSVRCLTNGAGAAYFGYEAFDPVSNSVKNIYLFHTAAGQDAYTQMVLPRGALSLYVLTSVVATFTAEFAVVPGGN